LAADPAPQRPEQVHPDGLLCALVLAPNTFARNRFYGLFENRDLRQVRRRARHVRSILRQLTAPGRARAEIVGRLELADSSVLLRYRVDGLSFERTTSLSALESALLSYALHRTLGEELSGEDKTRVEEALSGLATPLVLG
jgi:hypothetical protein